MIVSTLLYIVHIYFLAGLKLTLLFNFINYLKVNKTQKNQFHESFAGKQNPKKKVYS